MPSTVHPVKALPPIRIYESTETQFTRNGLRCLSPQTAEVTLKEQQAHTIHLVHPLDDEGAWRTIRMSRILYVPIMYRNAIKYQPMRIYKIQKQRQNGGTLSITIDAKHVFYDLNSVMVQACTVSSLACQAAIAAVFSNIYRPTAAAQASDSFTYSSDISDTASAEYNNQTVTAALVGDESSIASIYGGELYADGFRFSINSRMEGAKDNAFHIAYNYNLTGITATYSTEGTYSAIVGESNIKAEKNKLLNGKGDQTLGTITFTKNEDDTVTVTATAARSSNTDYHINDTLPLKAGTYVLSGCPAGGNNNNTYKIQISGIGYDIGNGLEFTLANDTTIAVYIRIWSGYLPNNLVFKPMICTKAAWDASHAYAPTGQSAQADVRTVDPATLELPFDRTIYAKFSYDAGTPPEKFLFDIDNYTSDVAKVSASYQVNFADLPRSDAYEGFANLEAYEVGDTGEIYDEDLDISTVQKLVEKKLDVLTQTVISATLGSTPDSITRPRLYANTVTNAKNVDEKAQTAAISEIYEEFTAMLQPKETASGAPPLTIEASLTAPVEAWAVYGAGTGVGTTRSGNTIIAVSVNGEELAAVIVPHKLYSGDYISRSEGGTAIVHLENDSSGSPLPDPVEQAVTMPVLIIRKGTNVVTVAGTVQPETIEIVYR